MKRISFTLLLSFITLLVSANNITVANASLSGQNTTAHTEIINFDVAWENSWRTSTNESNYDGAWIFVKFRKQGTTDWRHCTINTTGFTAGTGGTFKVPTDGKGAFIYKAADGIGNVNYTGNQLIWNYGLDGILDNETVEIRVFALEMVYIPQGSFLLGSGGTESNFFQDGTSGLPYNVASNSSITIGTVAGTLNSNGVGLASGSIPTAYPKGFSAFWIMKYETSQQQYVDFLNHLDLARATANLTVNNGYTGTHPNLIALYSERAQGDVGVNKSAALADWSGLRPMSELEYEKACRGFNTPAVPNEYPWGNTTNVEVATIANAGQTDEVALSPANANSNFIGGYAERTRVGIFARTSGSSRVLSGATYYGVMNMADNVNEICFAITAPGVLANATVHGDGYLANDGRTDIAVWQNTGAYGFRGGSYQDAASLGKTSYRGFASYFLTINPNAEPLSFGIRFTRTAP